MGLAALKISERCAHAFPTCDLAARVSHTPGFAGGGKLAGSEKMGARAAEAESLWKAIGWPLRATGEARGPAGGLWRPNGRVHGPSGTGQVSPGGVLGWI